MADIRELTAKTLHTLKEEGIISVGRKAKSYVHTARTVGRDAKDRVYKDVLFINGCDESVPHPARYRVTHQSIHAPYHFHLPDITAILDKSAFAAIPIILSDNSLVYYTVV